MNITSKQVIKYVALPQILPRIKALSLNLGWFAYLMALIFAATRILPRGHKYTLPSAYGKFGIGDILFEAGHHIKGGIRHTDQYIVYISFVLGVLLLLGQFVILLFILATHTAEAAIPWAGMFETPVRDNDLALMMLDKVFEIPNMFGSQFNPATLNDVTFFGKGMHNLFYFYNKGMLCIAGLIIVYYIFAVVIETMQTGTPFGQRFQEVYVPIRICIAIFLLLPLGYGFSAGQLLVLKLADYGSGLATNGWLLFNERAATNPMGLGAEQLLVTPRSSETGDLIRFYALTHACRAIYTKQYGNIIKPYIISAKSGQAAKAIEANGLSYQDVLQYFPRNDIKVTFGEKQDGYTKYPGLVKPYCGSVSISTADYSKEGPKIIQAVYWDFLGILWNDPNLTAYGDRMADNFTGRGTNSGGSISGWPDATKDPEVGFYANTRAQLQAAFAGQMETAASSIRALPESKMQMGEDMLKFGWGGAGIWFNKIAEYNGSIVRASEALPVPSSYPKVLLHLLNKKKFTDHGLGNTVQFSPTFSDGSALTDMIAGGSLDEPAKDAQIASFLDNIYSSLSKDDTFGDGTDVGDHNIIARYFNMVFGTYGLFQLRGNDEIHPLAKMSALGRAIIDRAVMYMGGVMVMGGLAGISSILDSPLAASAANSAFTGIAGMFRSFALVGLLAGIILYYVIPFLPFLYFFFAVGRWVKSIFEAVVGIPLWALAHLRIDGQGIPGSAAANGYYLLLEIMLRPILVIFGLMAAVGTFSALAIALDTIFDLVIANVAGYTPIDKSGTITWNNKELQRGEVDEFFYTIMYAVLLYMMALSCFKLIDLIPNSVLRFAGSQVAEFSDKMNLEQDMIRYTGFSSYKLTQEAGEAAQDFGKLAGELGASPVTITRDFKNMSDRMSPPKGGGGDHA